ncbi:MAG: hypothetical protein A2845_04405 [Candidatus Lloydbacteria bacterium RIFCSPHIGHO2_01_FULL_49_22]|uniref:DUF2933 domain-containing protein n=1 Tax=Candidatus Lloydbacteria bacterium RIFCSPHIGHO2_01_FULL_49_22 TaxID=1798658 RepID=A0A1G2CUL1_9BACT|nr:MAG: hypothetical protein A2845_04405 [Candidatus Lloydbacteria bacterium RIFCSPHIGHO2_01_FULL_49_22]OGZ08892.1 MAG: hypothetical protein A3C14_01440 [Candidatus Lloydbacteria bacterium RIFCSPHIGHO2_02_FULL_50_18]
MNNQSSFHLRYVLLALLMISGIYLVANHGEHLAPYLSFTFLLGCFFMHLLMHGSHGGHVADLHKEHKD